MLIWLAFLREAPFYLGNFWDKIFPSMNNEKQIHVRMSQSVFEEANRSSEEIGVSMNDYVVNAVMQKLEKERKEKLLSHEKSGYTFIDLFAGIGGTRIGFENAGCSCVYSNEYNKFCQKTYFTNFGEVPEGDITKVNANSIPDHDILVGGFPCQPFSIAGVSKKNSLGRPTGFEDKTQGTLFFDVCRIIKAKRPMAFMLENVKNLVSHDHGKTFKVICESLSELDYAFFYKVIDGQLYVPQHRERIIIVGFDKKRFGDEIDFSFDLHPVEPKPKLKDILEDNSKVDEKYTLTDHLWKYLQDYAAMQKAKGNGFGYGMPSLDGVSRTLSARYYKDGAEILIQQKGKNPRRLTPRECARLQGFPETYLIPVSDNQAYHQFGNSVVVPLISDVAGLIVSKLNELCKKRKAK